MIQINIAKVEGIPLSTFALMNMNKDVLDIYLHAAEKDHEWHFMSILVVWSTK